MKPDTNLQLQHNTKLTELVLSVKFVKILTLYINTYALLITLAYMH